MLNEPFTILLVILAIGLVGTVLVKLEDWLRAWYHWRKGPGWIEGKAKRPRKGSKD